MASSSSQATTTPSISVRKHLRWLPDGESSEPTSTIVLTTHNNHYVDVRIFKPTHVASPLDPPSTKAALPVSRLDWAFGGTAESTLHTRRQSSSANSTGSGNKDKLKELTSITPEGSKAQGDGNTSPTDPQPHHKRKQSGPAASTSRHTTWTHWVDSRHSKGIRSSLGASKTPHSATFAGKSPDYDWVDSGTIYPTDKDNESLEKGRMPNPETGLMTDYEELWRDLPLLRLPHEPGLITFVLQAENKILGTRGLVIRIGSWCQGVIRSGADLGVERWRYGGVVPPGGSEPGLVDLTGGIGDGIGGEHKWERLAKVGEMSLPCQVCWEKGWELKVGEEVVSGGLKWEVVERVVWKE